MSDPKSPEHAPAPQLSAPVEADGPAIDLDDVVPKQGQAKPVEDGITTQAYDPRPHEDTARRHIAYALISLLLIICVATFATLWWTDIEIQTVIRVVELLLGPVIALVSAATGFYYGAKSHGK